MATDEAVSRPVLWEMGPDRPFPSPLWREGAARLLAILFAERQDELLRWPQASRRLFVAAFCASTRFRDAGARGSALPLLVGPRPRDSSQWSFAAR